MTGHINESWEKRKNAIALGEASEIKYPTNVHEFITISPYESHIQPESGWLDFNQLTVQSVFPVFEVFKVLMWELKAL